jgi:dihydropyrimidinase
MTYDLRIANADVVLPDGVRKLDILVGNGVVADLVEPGQPGEAVETLDATGLHVLPGVVDAHVHLGPNITYPQSPEDVAPETQSAAAGGVTTLLAYLMSAQPYHDVFPIARDAMAASSVIDFGFHFCVVTREQLEAIPDYASSLGVSSYKFFMNFRGEEGAYLGLPGNDDGFMFDLLQACADNGTMLDPHAENIELVWRLRAMGLKEGRTPLDSWNLARPDYVEAEALNRLAFLARVTGASVYAVHTTNALALDVLRQGRLGHEGIFVESCPHYLTLDVDSDCGTYGKVNPPLRTAADRDALWAAVADGSVDTIGSDHVPRHRSFKEKDIWAASAGFPGLENLLPTLLSSGHHERGLPLTRIAEVASERPARLFGLYPQKGVIRVGSDADFAIVDLNETYRIVGEEQLSASAYSPWDGWEMTGRVRHTYVRGNRVYSVGEEFRAPTGQYLSRAHSGTAALEAAR